MKLVLGRICILAALTLSMLPGVICAQYNLATNTDGSVTITKYTGAGGDVTIPSNIVERLVTSIGEWAFDSSSLTSVTMPQSVANIGSLVFFHCSSLTNIGVHAANANYSSADGVLFDKAKRILVQYPAGKAGAYVIPNGVTTIGNWAFDRCANLTGVTMPNSVTNIGYMAFHSCRSVTSVSMPNSVATIDILAFGDCSGLTNVIIGSGVTSIGGWAFESCANLTSVSIPSSVTILGHCAFRDCSGLRTVLFKGDRPSVGINVFPSSINVTFYHLPGATGWGDSLDQRPAFLWNPRVPNQDSLGYTTNAFWFTIVGSSNMPLVIESTSNLAGSVWTVVGTNTLTGGSSQFTDTNWQEHRVKYYRFRIP